MNDFTQRAALTMRVSPLLTVLCFAYASSVSADESATKHPLEPASTTSPRATLKTFMETFREVYDIVERQDDQTGSGASHMAEEGTTGQFPMHGPRLLFNRTVNCSNAGRVPSVSPKVKYAGMRNRQECTF